MNIKNLLLFEPKDIINFYPFSILHPIWNLRIGKYKIFERYAKLFQNSVITFYGRNDHLNAFLAKYKIDNNKFEKGDLLAINCSILPTNGLLTDLKTIFAENKNGPFLIKFKGNIVGIYLTQEYFVKADEFSRPELLSNPEIDLFKKFPQFRLEKALQLNYLFNIFDMVGEIINEDLHLEDYTDSISNFDGVYLLNKEHIQLSKSANIAPNCVIDASQGAVIIDDNAKIMPQSTIIGPVYIGKNSIVKIGAKIYHDTVIGNWCKVGGEIENSVIQDYSNKQHEGFLGHSFLGEWVNLGADTNTSDLKNTYSNIKIRIERTEIETGRMFLGTLCGDHTKTGINTMFTTGTVTGICGILVREWFLPNFIPSFSWGGAKDSPIYKVERALETARIVMKRRNKELLPEEEKLIRNEYERVISMEHR